MRIHPPIDPSGEKKSKYHDSPHSGSGPGSCRRSSDGGTIWISLIGCFREQLVVRLFFVDGRVGAFDGGQQLVGRRREVARDGPVEVVDATCLGGERTKEREV